MSKRGWSVLMILGSLALGGVLASDYMNSDNTPPVLKFSDVQMSYYDGISQEQLLKGVSAYDEMDGDLTDKVFVDQIIKDNASKEVIVVYGVQDRTHNVTTGRRSFKLQN